IANGTGSLVNTGPGQFLVTNNHVYEAFQTRRAASDSVLLLMSGRGGLGFLDISENRLVSRDRERDPAVLEIPVSHVRLQGKLFSTWNSWPPPRPAVGMPALIYGYPGEGRVPLGDSLGIRPLTMGRYVASVTDRHFSLADIHGDSEMRTPEGATPITNNGGISGRTGNIKGVMLPRAETSFLTLAIGFACVLEILSDPQFKPRSDFLHGGSIRQTS